MIFGGNELRRSLSEICSLDLYSSGTFVNVLEKDLDGAGSLKVPETFRPFNNDSRIRIVENLVEAEAFEAAGLDAIEIDVIDLRPASVLVDQREGGARNVIRVFKPETGRKPTGKRRLPCPKISV